LSALSPERLGFSAAERNRATRQSILSVLRISDWELVPPNAIDTNHGHTEIEGDKLLEGFRRYHGHRSFALCSHFLRGQSYSACISFHFLPGQLQFVFDLDLRSLSVGFALLVHRDVARKAALDFDLSGRMACGSHCFMEAETDFSQKNVAFPNRAHRFPACKRRFCRHKRRLLVKAGFAVEIIQILNSLHFKY
jgi:hypothetical protein